MLPGDKVGLRAIVESDLPALLALESDVETAMAANGGPWRPVSLAESTASLAKRTADPPAGRVDFAVEELATGELVGDAQLWGIDTHNRCAHLGFFLLPGARGRGLGSDTIRTLCDYGFRVRGLHRLQLETNATNAAARAAAVATGFVLEGQLRACSWVAGEFVDEAIYGLLADEWRARA